MNPHAAAKRLAWAASVLAVLVPSMAGGDEPMVPVPLQMDLLVKLAPYDHNFVRRAGERVVVLIVVKANHDPSQRVASQALLALKDQPGVAGLPHTEELVTFATAEKLADTCKERRAAIIYVTPGFDDAEVEAMGRALAGLDVLSVSAVPAFVRKGIVVGFELVSGKAKILVALGQAERQRVSLSSNLLRLAKVLP
ncbi:MAG: YfiR family protein [Myxococcales bacterium]